MPKLIIIAGCNGAGKSTFAPSLLPENIDSFDFDKKYLDRYKSLPDSEFRDKFARDKTIQEFEEVAEYSLKNQTDFCYETNFDSFPTYWPEIFKKSGFRIMLIFFCLENQDIARHRIQVRTEFKGHFVDNETIDVKWKIGYKNLNLYFDLFDDILLIDNSVQNEIYSNILQIKNGEIELFVKELPGYFERRFPDLYKTIIKKLEDENKKSKI